MTYMLRILRLYVSPSVESIGHSNAVHRSNTYVSSMHSMSSPAMDGTLTIVVPG